MRRRLLPVLALALALPASIGLASSAEAAKPRCNGVKATIVGTNKSERIKGTKGRDVIVARGGNDRINGGGGNDVICGDGGKDTIDGGPGQDYVHGGAGNDLIALGPGNGGIGYGDAGDDTMATGATGQALFGGEGNDLLKTSWPVTLVNGEGGNDTLIGGADPDQLNGGDGDDHVSGGGGDDVDLNGGFGIDTCDGGPGRDNCNGGAPGGPGNSPTDPDICTSEVKQSCQGEEFPQRWLAKVSAVERTDTETRTWSLQMVLLRAGDPTTSSFWREESVSGTFSVQGHNDDCTWSHQGTLDRDFTGDLGLVPAQSLYWLDVVAGGVGTYTISCTGGGGYTEEQGFQAWAASEGGPDTLPWDRSRREITGSWHEDGSYKDVDAEWVITPLD